MEKIIKYGCYALLAVAVFIALWLMGGFISMEFDVRKWEVANRFLTVALTVAVVAPTIGYKETT